MFSMGSITGFLQVLVEGDDVNERSPTPCAAFGRPLSCPAPLAMPKSVPGDRHPGLDQRLMNEIAPQEHLQMASSIVGALGILRKHRPDLHRRLQKRHQPQESTTRSQHRQDQQFLRQDITKSDQEVNLQQMQKITDR
jgi:hypothetical protein